MKRHKIINKKYSLFDFDIGENWKKEWQGMPEFIQEDLQPYQTIKIHFETEEDVKEFAKLLNQKITIKTKYLWFPKQDIHSYHSKIYSDES